MKHRHKLTTILLGSLALSCAASHAQLKTGSNPATLTANTNLEVEATNGKKLLLNKADGTLTYQHVTQGDGKVLTSDPNGVATWQTPVTGTIVNATSTMSTSAPLLDISSTTPGPMDLGWKMDLTPGLWLINHKALVGALKTGELQAWVDIGLVDSSNNFIVTLDRTSSDPGTISISQNSRVVSIATAGTYRLAVKYYSKHFIGYIGCGLNSERDAATGLNWINATDFPSLNISHVWVTSDLGDPQAIKLK